MAIPDVNFDAAGVLTNQPSFIQVEHIQPPEDIAVNGGALGMTGLTKNRKITMKWMDTSSHGTLAELLTKRNSNASHTVTFNKPDGVSEGTVKVYWPTDPDYTFIVGQAFGEITVVLRERPD